jgi:hypothetical protein
MSATPLFLDDMVALQAALRLSALREEDDAVAILEQGLRAARVRFYQRLGTNTVDTILDTTYIEDPRTTSELKRYVGNLCEVELVRLQLMDRLPLLFMDASGAAREAFNNEGAFRSIDRQTLEVARARITSQVENWLAFMAGEVALGDGELAQVYTQTKSNPTPILGGTPFIGVDQSSATPYGLDPGEFDGNFMPDDDEIGGVL